MQVKTQVASAVWSARSSWWVTAWTISLLLHTAVLLVGLHFGPQLGAGPIPAAEVEREIVIQLAADSLPDTESFQPIDHLEHDHSSAAVPLQAAADPTANQLDQVLDQVLHPAADQQAPLGSLESDLQAATKLPALSFQGMPPVGETQFFGTTAKGSRFVYVIDRSASMRAALPAAKAELLASLEQLPPTAEFQVVFYHLEARVLELDRRQKLVPATRENKQKAARWLETLHSEGGTDHMKAPKKGLTFAPHVIFFLTDADELRPAQVQELTTLNQRGGRARIHCIELSTANADQMDNSMRRLARENGGEYRGIDLTHFRLDQIAEPK